jgi:hypothetical protein
MVVSTVGALLIVPWGLFFGVMFTFAFGANESAWAWGFDIVSFWFQIPAVIVSFFRPRIAAWWMLANVLASVLMGMWFEIHDASHLVVSEWISTLLPLLKTCIWFWGLPTLFAVLLLMAERNRLYSTVEGEGF